METVEEFLARGGKIQQLPQTAEQTIRQLEQKVEAKRLADKLAEKNMRDAENRKGCYSAYWGEE